MANVILRLPILRAERRLSQRQLAARAGIRPDTVSAMESGDTTSIRFDTIARLCEVLDCEPGDLFELEEDFHKVPVLGGDDEDEIIRQRLADSGRRVDGPTFAAELMKLAGHAGSEARRRRAAG